MSFDTSHLWSQGQKAVYASLCEQADLFLNSDWAHLAIRPRMAPLVIGESGSGKSHLIREVARREFGLPCLRLTASNWMVSGARESTPTLLRVHQFVSENDQGVLHFDELDKFRLGQSDWSGYVVGELFDLLDRAPSQPIKDAAWSSEILHKLKHDFWVVGSGTWQQLWVDASKAKVGFGSQQDGISLLASIQRSVETTEVIALELLRRFNRKLEILAPATEEDYKIAAEDSWLGQARLRTEGPARFCRRCRVSPGGKMVGGDDEQLTPRGTAREPNRPAQATTVHAGEFL